MPKYVSEGGTGTEGGRRAPKIKVGGGWQWRPWKEDLWTQLLVPRHSNSQHRPTLKHRSPHSWGIQQPYGYLFYSLTTDKRKLGQRLSGLELHFPGSMGEGQKADSSVFRAGPAVSPASKSCLAANNVKTRLPPGCLTRNAGWVLAPD